MPRVTTFRQHILSRDWVPWWLAGPNRGRINWAIGLTLDVGLEWLFTGIQERYPSFCSEEALFWLGRDRGIERGVLESSASFRDRLRRFRDIWRQAGTAWAVLYNVQSYFLPQRPRVRVFTHNPHRNESTCWTLDPDGTLSRHVESPSVWDWDSQYDRVQHGLNGLNTRDARFWVVIYQPSAATDNLYDDDQSTDGSSAPTTTWATDGDYRYAEDLKRFARKWKMAGSYCAGIIVTDQEDVFAPDGSGPGGYPDGTWYRQADPLNNNEFNRNPYAQYLEDLPGYTPVYV